MQDRTDKMDKRKNDRRISFRDNRGGKIVYISCCLLNQNSHAPGVAARKGSFKELIQVFLDNNIGIEQIPCMECKLWGGVSRKLIQKSQPIVLKSVTKVWFPIIEFFTNMMMLITKYSCRKEAKKLVNRIQDYLTEGYAVLGIIGVNGSPTCGVTKTINYLKIVKNMDKLDITPQDIINPKLEKTTEIEYKSRINESGIFFSPLISELKRKKLNLKIEGVEYSSDPQEEAARIADLLCIDNKSSLSD